MRSAYDWYQVWFVAKRKRVARKDPEWLAIELRRTNPLTSFRHHSLADVLAMHQIESRLVPHTFVHKSKWWLDKHGPKAQRRAARDFYQRGSRGFADRDTWNLDDYLAGHLAALLAHLRDHTHGYPSEYDDADDGVALLPGEVRWTATLNELIAGFQGMQQPWNTGVTKELFPDPDDFVEAYRAAREQADALKDATLALLAKHWYSLWD